MDPDSMELILMELDDPFIEPETDSGKGSHESSQPLNDEEDDENHRSDGDDVFSRFRRCSCGDEDRGATSFHFGAWDPCDSLDPAIVQSFLQSLLRLEGAARSAGNPRPEAELLRSLHGYLTHLRLLGSTVRRRWKEEEEDVLPMVRKVLEVLLQIKAALVLPNTTCGFAATNSYFHVAVSGHLTVLGCFHNLESTVSSVRSIRDSSDSAERFRFPRFDWRLEPASLLNPSRWSSCSESLWRQFLHFMTLACAERSTFGCGCVQMAWRSALERFSGDDDDDFFWSTLMSFIPRFFPPKLLWSCLSCLSPLLTSACHSTNLKATVEALLKSTLSDGPDDSELNQVMATLEKLPLQASAVILIQLWEFFQRRLNFKGSVSSLAAVPTHHASWAASRSSSEAKTAAPFDAFLSLLGHQLDGDDPRLGKLTKQFLGRIRSRLPSSLSSLDELGVVRIVNLFLVLHSARARTDPVPVMEAFVAIAKDEGRKPFSGRKLETFLRGIATFHHAVLTNGPTATHHPKFVPLLHRTFSILADRTNGALSSSSRAYLDVLVQAPPRSPLFLSQPGLVSIPTVKAVVASWSKPELKMLLLALSNVALRIAERCDDVARSGGPTTLTVEEKATFDAMQTNAEEMRLKAYPLLKPLYMVSSLEDATSERPHLRTLADATAAMDSMGGSKPLLSHAELIEAIGGLNIHPRFSAAILLTDHFRQRLRKLSSLQLAEAACFVRCAALAAPTQDDVEFVKLLGSSDPERFFSSADVAQRTKAFDVYRDVLVRYLKPTSSPSPKEPLTRLYALGATMVRCCARSMYAPTRNVNKLARILDLLFVAETKRGSFAMTEAMKKAVALSLPRTMRGIATLPDPASDPYIKRVMADIVSAYANRFSCDRTHPIILAFEKDGGTGVDYEALARLTFRALKNRVLPKDAKLVLDFASAAVNAHRGSSWIHVVVVVEELLPALLSTCLASGIEEHFKGTANVTAACCELGPPAASTSSRKILEAFVESNLWLNKDKVFRILAAVAERRPTLVRDAIPNVKATVENIGRMADGYGCELLRRKLRELENMSRS